MLVHKLIINSYNNIFYISCFVYFKIVTSQDSYNLSIKIIQCPVKHIFTTLPVNKGVIKLRLPTYL